METIMRTIADLEPHEQKEISRKFFEKLGADRSVDLYQLHAEVIMSHGLMCPHPLNKRIARSRWYICGCCGLDVIGDHSLAFRQNFPALSHGAM